MSGRSEAITFVQQVELPGLSQEVSADTVPDSRECRRVKAEKWGPGVVCRGTPPPVAAVAWARTGRTPVWMPQTCPRSPACALCSKQRVSRLPLHPRVLILNPQPLCSGGRKSLQSFLTARARDSNFFFPLRRTYFRAQAWGRGWEEEQGESEAESALSREPDLAARAKM